MGTVATSKYRPPPRRQESRAAARAPRDPRPTLVQFVVLSMCLHALAILLFGAPRGGSREGRAMWGALEVELDRSYREAMPALRIERALDALRAAPEKPRAPARTRARPRREPPMRLDAAKELAAPIPAPQAPSPQAPVLPTPAPPARPELVVPPMLERLAPAPKLEKLETFTVPPPTDNQGVAPLAPEAVPAPIEMQALPRIEAAPLPSMATPPLPREALAPMSPIAAPALPALAPVERARIEAPVAKPVEVQPLEAPVAKPVEVQPLEAPVAKPVEAQPLEAPVAKPAEVPPAVEAPALPSVPAIKKVPVTRPVPMQAPAARAPSMPAAASPDAAPTEPPSRFRAPAARADAPGSDYDPTKPQRPLDLDTMRKRAGELAREGAGNRALLAFPLPPVPKEKSKLEKGIEKAWKPDCKTAYSSLGLAAVVPLIANEFGEGNCRW